MRVLDLFSGIGGFSLGLKMAGGFETVQFCEIDPWCRQVLAKNFPGVPIHDDIRTLSSDALVNAWYPSEMVFPRKNYDEAIRLYEHGLSVGDVAEFYRVSRQAMWAILKRRGVVFRPQLRYGTDNHFHRGTSDDDYAQGVVEKAIAKGLLIPQQCELCGESGRMKDGRRKVQAHHDDYNKPLAIRWLCQKHHHEWHKTNKAIARKEVDDESAADVVCGGFP